MAIKEIDGYDAWERAFQGHVDLEPLLKGIDSHEQALKAHRKAHRYDASAETKERIAEQLAEYRGE